MFSLGFIEVSFFSIACVVADQVAKASGVRVLGFDTSGNPELVIRIAGGTADVKAALDAASDTAKKLGVPSLATSLSRPHEDFAELYAGPNSISPLYGGPDQFLPTVKQSKTSQTMSKDTQSNPSQQAVGILETQGLTAILEATDAMLKAADVKLVGKEKIGAAYVTIVIRGDVAAVKAAIDAGSAAAARLGKVIAAHVIARPHEELVAILPK